MSIVKTLSHSVNGTIVEQRPTDGFINATTMCVAHEKRIGDWLALDSTLELVTALANRLDINSKGRISALSLKTRVSGSYPTLVVVKKGSPEFGGGTWIHPKLAVHLAQWCSPVFALQVSDWIEEWITTGRNPIQIDNDRVAQRLILKDQSRVLLNQQIKIYLEDIDKYSDSNYVSNYYSRVHDAINLAITSETSSQMKTRLTNELGRKLKKGELIRNYFPTLVLEQFNVMCQATTNLMIRYDMEPFRAIRNASHVVLPMGYVPQKIEFINLAPQLVVNS